ncbi:MAG TPA: biotin--[acetyl-CoA-carboxylase] ligase [Micropepsaceae bacterium]|nr:biotin--[acetyl-CoA-carboxylase] ligase [Micropepsaceae bacterium]
MGLRRYDTLDSTNEEARRLAKNGERGPLWIVAREQTAGRGRRGRAWISESGNLFATLLMPVTISLSAQLGFVAGLAAGDAIAAHARGAEVALKWPNDVLLNGKKVAGILLEALGHDSLAIGIGINLAHYPNTTEIPSISIAAVMGKPPDLDGFLVRLASAMTAWYEIWLKEGFQPVRKAWLVRASGLGHAIRARLADSERDGVFEDLDQDGALLLRDSTGTLTRITAGDVFFRP